MIPANRYTGHQWPGKASDKAIRSAPGHRDREWCRGGCKGGGGDWGGKRRLRFGGGKSVCWGGIRVTGGGMEEPAQPDEAVPIKQRRRTSSALCKDTAQPFRKKGSNFSHDDPCNGTVFPFLRAHKEPPIGTHLRNAGRTLPSSSKQPTGRIGKPCSASSRIKRPAPGGGQLSNPPGWSPPSGASQEWPVDAVWRTPAPVAQKGTRITSLAAAAWAAWS